MVGAVASAAETQLHRERLGRQAHRPALGVDRVVAEYGVRGSGDLAAYIAFSVGVATMVRPSGTRTSSARGRVGVPSGATSLAPDPLSRRYLTTRSEPFTTPDRLQLLKNRQS